MSLDWRPADPARPRFLPAPGASKLRVLVGAWGLVEAGSIVFSALGLMGTPSVIHAAERVWARAAARLLRLDLEIEGMANVDLSQSYVVVALHESFADAIALLHLPLRLKFLVRDELFTWKPLGRYLRATKQIEVSETRGISSLRRLFDDASASLRRGDSLVIFPQGSVLGLEVAFQPGAFRLAQRLDTPVLPVVLSGGHTVWEHPFSPLVRLDRRLSMRVLPPLETDELSGIGGRELERRMKAIALGEASAPPRRFDPDRDGWWEGYRYEIDSDYPELARRKAEMGGAGDTGE